MALLDELFGGQGQGVDPMQMRLLMERLSELQGRGGVTVSDPANFAGSAPAMPPVRDIPTQTAPGQPYSANPVDTGTTPPPRRPAARSQIQGEKAAGATPEYKDRSPSFGEMAVNFGMALAGQKPENLARQYETENMTVRALMKKGLGIEEATAIARNPQLLTSAFSTAIGLGGKLGLNPVWGTDEEGNLAIGQMSPTGQVVRSKLPEGFKPSTKNLLKVDAGTEFHMIDPLTKQIVQRIPKDVAGAAAAKKEGEDLGTTRANLGNTLAKGEYAKSVLDMAINSPDREWNTGLTGWLPSVLPGARSFKALVDQLKGQSFLEAYQMLRGGGHISNAEGSKATEAIARLDVTMREEDFKASLEELKGIIDKGMERAKAKAAGGSAAAAASAEQGSTLAKARDAIAKGADRNAVIQRLRDAGIDPSGL